MLGDDTKKIGEDVTLHGLDRTVRFEDLTMPQFTESFRAHREEMDQMFSGVTMDFPDCDLMDGICDDDYEGRSSHDLCDTAVDVVELDWSAKEDFSIYSDVTGGLTGPIAAEMKREEERKKREERERPSYQ